MKIENKLSLSHLKHNIRRTIITIIGITLAVAMFTSVVVAGSSFLDYVGNSSIVENGNYHFMVRSSNDETISVLDDNENVDDYCFEYRLIAQDRGYYIKQGKNKRTSIGDWICGDSKFLSWMINNNYRGELPSTDGEIIIGDKLINDNNLDWKIGDTVEIATIYRYFGFENHPVMNASGRYNYDELYNDRFTGKYRITGVIENSNKIYRYMDNNRENANTYVRLNKLDPTSVQKIYSIFKSLDINVKEYVDSALVNSNLLLSHLSVEPSNKIAIGIIGVTVVILLVIMLFAIAMIHNAFSMSNSEKVRYLGMLASVGATRKQKLKSSYFEAFILGVIGIVLGFALGIGITEALILTIGRNIIENGVIIGADMIKLKISAPAWALTIILALSAVTILISTYKPALRSSMITPIDAIRHNDEFKHIRKTRNPWLIKKLFGYEGVLAYKNQKRNGRKGRLITASIAFSIVLLTVSSYACDIGMQAANISDEVPYQIQIGYSAKDHTKFQSFLDSIDEVDRYYDMEDNWFFQNFKSDGSGEFFYYLDAINKETLTKKYQKLVNSNIAYVFYVIMDDDFNAYCRKNGIDPKPYYELDHNKVKCVVMNNISHKKNAKPVFTDKLLGQEMYEYCMETDELDAGYVKWFNDTAIHYVFSDFAQFDDDNYMCHLAPVNSVSCFVPLSAYRKYEYDISGMSKDSLDYIAYGIETKDHKKVATEIRDYLDANNEEEFEVYDYQEQRAIANTTVTVAKTMIYGFIILIIMIVMFNIINIISTSTELRRKEFAMLKSVGTSPSGFKKMIALESIFYDLHAILCSVPISVGLCYLVNYALGDGKIPFTYNIPLCIGACLASFVIVMISMMLGLNQSNDNSIIEDLKND